MIDPESGSPPEAPDTAGLADRSRLRLPIDHQFDVSLANDLARLESYNKHHYRPNTYLHKWWARRCGTTFRMLLKHLVADEATRGFYAPGGLTGTVILDPMMGGGTTLHEAIRLGANVVGYDLDPIPVLQARASLSDVPLSTLEADFETFISDLSSAVESLFLTNCPHCDKVQPFRFLLYGLRRHCDCGPAIFVDSLTLRREKDGRMINLCPACHGLRYSGERCRCPEDSGHPPLREKGTILCPACLAPYRDELQTPYYARYVPLVVVSQCASHGLLFGPVGETDRALILAADQQRDVEHFRASLAVENGPKSSDLLRKGIKSYADLFSSRQLLYLQSAIRLTRDYDRTSNLYLSLLVSTSLEFNSMLCGYKGSGTRRAGAIRHVFSHHAYSLPYTAVENNPIYPRAASGTLQKLFHDRVRRARRWAMSPIERRPGKSPPTTISITGELDFGREVESASNLGRGSRRFLLRQQSAAALDLPDNSIDYIVTDPPYFDSVQYSDLAKFFHVWLRQLIPERFQRGLVWDYDVTQSAVDLPGNNYGVTSEDQYVGILRAVFRECHRVLRKDRGRLIFSFHHWNPRGWTALTLALRQANFILINRYVVHSENPVSVHIANLKALSDDAILVLAPAQTADEIVWERPLAIDLEDSARFCHDCATALGWMLMAPLKDDELLFVWRELLEPGTK